MKGAQNWFTVQDKRAELDTLRNEGIKRGFSVGWAVHHLDISIKLGTTTYIAGAPHDGKTEFWLEILLNLSHDHGLRHAIFTPETGSVAEVIAELCHKLIGKPYIEGPGAMTEAEKTYAEMFIDEHFFIIDPIDEDLTVSQFYKLVEEIEAGTGKTIHTTCIDPFNEIKHDFTQDSGRQDLYIERILGDVRKNARKTGRHNCIITHVRDQQQITADGVTYSPMPTARDFAGGQAWFRKGMLILIVWRPPAGLQDADGTPFKFNETHVRVAKSKPKGVSKNGIYKMFFDVRRSAYYVEGDLFAKRHRIEPKPEPKAKELQPNTDFEEVKPVSASFPVAPKTPNKPHWMDELNDPEDFV